MTRMLASGNASAADVEDPDKRQHDKTDPCRENHKHRRVAVFEIAINEILVHMGGRGPQHRPRKCEEKPHNMVIISVPGHEENKKEHRVGLTATLPLIHFLHWFSLSSSFMIQTLPSWIVIYDAGISVQLPVL